MSLHQKDQFPGGPNTTRGEATHVYSDPSGESDRIAYASGRSAVLRSVRDPRDVAVFSDHIAPVSCCRFAPRSLMVSGDEGGEVRVWDPETLKQRGEAMQVVGDTIRDLDYTADMKFLAVASDARGSFAKAVKYPGGSSAGAFSGHLRRVTCIDVRSSAPVMTVTGGDDMLTGLYLGPPISMKATPKIQRHHKNFVLGARFSPDGRRYATCSADRSIVVLDAETGETVHTLLGHEGSVTAVAWNKDASSLVSVSSDKTVRLWDVSGGGRCLAALRLASDTNDALDQLVGCTWIHKSNELVALSLRGELMVIDAAEALAPKTDDGSARRAPLIKRTLRGHAKSVVALANRGSQVFTLDYSGLCVLTDVAEPGSHAKLRGNGVQGALGTALAVGARFLYIAAADGRVLRAPLETLEIATGGAKIENGCVGVACAQRVSGGGGEQIAAVNSKRVVIIGEDGQPAHEVAFQRGEDGCSVAMSDDGAMIAVGLEQRGGAGKVVIFAVGSDSTLTRVEGEIDLPSAANRMLFSRDAQTLVVGQKSRLVRMYDVATREAVAGGGPTHTTRVDGMALSPDGSKVATVGLDGLLVVWTVRSDGPGTSVKAHRSGASGVGWIDDRTLVTSGGDNVLRTWALSDEKLDSSE